MVSVRSRPAPSPTGTPSPRPRGVGRLRPPVTMIECDFCGCSSPKPDKGWMAYPDEDVAGAPGMYLLPVIAFAVLGHSLDEAHVIAGAKLSDSSAGPERGRPGATRPRSCLVQSWQSTRASVGGYGSTPSSAHANTTPMPSRSHSESTGTIMLVRFHP